MNRMTSDIYWVFWREIKRFSRERPRLLMIVLQPIIWLVLMGNNLAGLTSNPFAARMLGTDNYLAFMTPGVMIMTALFGGVFGGTSVLWDRRLGFLNKMLASPIHRAAIPLGKMAAMMVQSWAQMSVILLVAMAMGVRIATGLPGIVFMLLTASIFGTIMGGISLTLASRMRTMEAFFAIINFLTMPLMFTSNAIFPTQAMPVWLRQIARVNPLSYAVAPMRAISTQGWLWGEIGPSLAVLVIMALISATISVRQFLKAVA